MIVSTSPDNPTSPHTLDPSHRPQGNLRHSRLDCC